MSIPNIIKDVSTWSHNGKILPKEWIYSGLVLCVVVAFCIRLLSLWVEPTISRDGIVYISNAEIVQKKHNSDDEIIHSFAAGELHLYSLYLSLSKFFYLTPAQLGVGTNVVLGTMLTIIFFGISKILFKNSELALSVAFLVALHPTLVQYSIAIQREMPYLFVCGIFFLFLLFFYLSNKWYWCIGLGATAALGMFLRYEGTELVIITIVLFVMKFYNEYGARLRIFLILMFFLFSFAFCSCICLTLLQRSPQENINVMLNKVWRYANYTIKQDIDR